MIIRFISLGCFVLSLFPFHGFAVQSSGSTEVYRDDYISVHAEIVNLERQIVHFGDVLSLAVRIYYDPAEVRLPELDAGFFTSVWPEIDGPFLLDNYSIEKSGKGQFPREQLYTYRFQILACPDGEILCRGSRQYYVPEFNIEYELLDAPDEAESVVPVKLQPWPGIIMVASAIPLDEEGELNSFPTYFPTGAYPQPLSGEDVGYPPLGLIASGMFLLLGGLLMSPLSFFKRGSLTASRPETRWEHILEKLKTEEFDDEVLFLDNLRRCVVWYCVDEVGVDPFYWVKHEEEVSGAEQKGTGEFAELKEIFLALTYNPKGEGKSLLERFSNYVRQNK